MEQKVVKQEMNDGITCSIAQWESPYIGNEQICQSRDFPTELCCNTIVHLLFHYFLLHRFLLHFLN